MKPENDFYSDFHYSRRYLFVKPHLVPLQKQLKNLVSYFMNLPTNIINLDIKKSKIDDEQFWKCIRASFNLSSDYVHFEAFSLSSHPEPVRKAIETYRQHLDENPHVYLFQNQQRLESDARKSIADFIGAEKDEIIITENATTGLSLIYNGLRLHQDDEILTTEHEHHSNLRALENLAQRTGATLKIVELYKDGGTISPEKMADSLISGLSDKTRLIALTWVHSCTGVCIPVSFLVKAVQQYFAKINKTSPLICVDGTHGCGALKFDVINMGCDIFISGCHKWLHGPRGTGFIWANKKVMNRLEVVIPSFALGEVDRFRGVKSPGYVDVGEHLSPGGYRCFEHRWAIPIAINFIQNMGIQIIQQRIQNLALYLKLGLSKIEGVNVITPIEDEYSAGIICFSITGLTPKFVADKLYKLNIICIVSPYKVQYCRFSTSIYNFISDIDQAIEAVRLITNMDHKITKNIHIKKNHNPQLALLD